MTIHLVTNFAAISSLNPPTASVGDLVKALGVTYIIKAFPINTLGNLELV